MFKGQASLTITQLLLDLKYGKDVVDYILSRDRDRDSNGNGANTVDDEDRGNQSTCHGGDIEDNALC